MAGTSFQFLMGQCKGKDANAEPALERFERYLENMDSIPYKPAADSQWREEDFDDSDKNIVQIEGGRICRTCSDS